MDENLIHYLMNFRFKKKIGWVVSVAVNYDNILGIPYNLTPTLWNFEYLFIKKNFSLPWILSMHINIYLN